MPLKIKQHRQFSILITCDLGITLSSVCHSYQHIIAVTQQKDILTHIATTQFDLILVDPTVNGDEFITHLKTSLCLNNKTPIIAIINTAEDYYYVRGFDDTLVKPITEEQLNKFLDLWKTKTIALDYIHQIMSKTKNNQRLALTIFEKLFEELPLQVIAIEEAIKNKHYDLVQAITHKLNGSVSFCGLQDIQEPAKALEICLLNNEYAAANQTVNQLFLMLQECTLNFILHQEVILAILHKLSLPRADEH